MPVNTEDSKFGKVVFEWSLEAKLVSIGVALVQYNCCSFVMGAVPSAAKGLVGTFWFSAKESA